VPQRKRAGATKARAAIPENVKLVLKSAENFEEKARKNAVTPLGASQAFAG
jgi:hypothetical protein